MPKSLSSLVRSRIQNALGSLPFRPTQSAIADALGVTQTWVSHYLRGRHEIDLDTLGKLCGYLGIRMGSLFEGGDVVPLSTLPAGMAETWTLLQSITDDERDAVRDILRIMARRPSAKRARK